MSQYTIQIDQFLLNKLQPEIDKLNLSLVSMEEYGYDSRAMRNTRSKLNKLIIVYDFLKEYAYGNEESDLDILRDVMKITGAYTSTNKSNSTVIQTTRDNIDINEIGGCLNFTRVYINDRISTSKTLAPSEEPVVIKVYASDSVETIEVAITVTGSLPKIYTGVNYITIQDIDLSEIESIILDITTTNICGETNITQKVYKIQDISCSAATYWLGGTVERFKIDALDLNESSDISIDPNSGTNSLGELLTYDWISNNDIEMEEVLFREKVTQEIDVVIDDSHALLLIPVTLGITDVNELVAGSPVDMIEGIHYDIFPITSPTLKQYNCIYFRDLTSLTFKENRIFQFTIDKI